MLSGDYGGLARATRGSLGLGKEESQGEKGQPRAILAWPPRCPQVQARPVSSPAAGFWNLSVLVGEQTQVCLLRR